MTSVLLFGRTDVVDFLEVPVVKFFTKSGSTPEIGRTKVRKPRTDVGLLAARHGGLEIRWAFRKREGCLGGTRPDIVAIKGCREISDIDQLKR